MYSPKSFVINSPLLRRTLRYLRPRRRTDQRKKHGKITHCIFDLDGTILDNQFALDKAIQTVFEVHGLQYSPEWRLKCMGRTGKAMWRNVIKEHKINADWRVLYNEYTDIARTMLINSPLRPGIERLVNHLKEHCIPMAVATSSTRTSMENKTRHIPSLMSKLSHVVCGGDDLVQPKSKPSGEIFYLCAYRFEGRPNPQECLVFEDSPIGVMAAVNASMQVIGIPCPPTLLKDLKRADEVLATLNDFWPGKYGMPPFPEQK